MQPIFLLVTAPNSAQEDPWQKSLQSLLAPLGELRTVQEQAAPGVVAATPCALVLIDAAHVDAAPLLVSTLRARKPDVRIVVITSSPVWDQARAAYEAGAIDYIPRSLSNAEIAAAITCALRTPLPHP